LWLKVFAAAALLAVFGSLGWLFFSTPPRPASETVAAPAPPPPASEEIASPPPRPTPIPRSAFPELVATPPGVQKPVNPTPIPVLSPPSMRVPKDVIANWQTPEGPALAEKFFTTWAATDPAAAGKWLTIQPDSPARHAAAEALALAWAARDLPAATGWALSLPEDGIMKSAIFDRLAALWVAKDPLAAAAYYARIADSETRHHAAAALFEAWGQRDPAGLYAALTKIPPVVNDDARMSLAPVLFPRNSSAAMNVLCGVKDREQRIHSLSQLYDYWRRRNRGAALTWVANSPLPDDERQRIAGPP
jgi:hypothetical protein